MKILRPLAGLTFNDHKINESMRRELQTECILDKIDEYRRNWFLHLQRMHKTESLSKHTTIIQKEKAIGRPKNHWREQL